ncbi:MAG TPA: lysophospholipid acyltransferase family protein [Rectinemataceae bacterium]|nr:lysophospholipid acyltransferase family protein [Rectinemataceae bacterium]
MAYKRGGALITRKPPFLAASYLLSWFVALIGWPVAKAYYGFTVTGRENLKATGKRPLIFVSNHSLPLDCLVHGLSILPGFSYFTIIEETILTPILGTLVRLLGGIPMPADPSRLPDIDEAMRLALEKRGRVYFYAEGECFLLNQEIKPLKAGAFYYAIKNNALIVPVVTVLKRPKRRVRPAVHFLPALEPPAAAGHATTDLHNAIVLSKRVRADMQRAIDSGGGDKSLYLGPMPRIRGVNDRER